jgi:2-oxoglutarate dehydrogenase E2 component (dihydrolipoamide succinyltransferase)
MADLVVPQLGESITEAVVARWLKNVGDTVALDEPLVDLETDKVTVQLPSPAAGALSAQSVEAGATVKVGQVVGKVDAGAAGKAAPAKAEAKAEAKPEAKPDGKKADGKADAKAPVVEEKKPAPPQAAVPGGGNGSGLDKDALLDLPPSQRRIARERGAIPVVTTGSGTGTGAAPKAQPKIDPRDEVVAMSPLRKRIAERLVQAQHESASLTTFNEVDMTAVMDLRAKYKESFEKEHGVKLGFMSFFVKACAAAARLFPGINAEVVGDSIVYKKHYDFGIAVSTPKGLVVPVLRNVDELSFGGIEKGILALAEKARSGKLAIDDLVGGTFSITNGGIYGSMMSTPLLNYPQTGILGMHNIVKRAMVKDDAVVVRPMMYVALTYDHRVVDGREAVSFLVAVKDRLESPDRMLLEG